MNRSSRLRTVTGAFLNPLTHCVHIPEMNGESLRLKLSRRKQAHSQKHFIPLLRARLGVTGPLSIRSRSPSTPHTQEPQRYWPTCTPPVAWLYSAFDSSLTVRTADCEVGSQLCWHYRIRVARFPELASPFVCRNCSSQSIAPEGEDDFAMESSAKPA